LTARLGGALLLLCGVSLAAPALAQDEGPTWEPGEEWQPAMEPPLVQWSVRYGFGMGAASKAMGEDYLLDTRLQLEQTLRTEVLFGKPGDEHFRVGPALDLRFQRFETAEIAGGLSVLFPIARGYPLLLTAAAGYAARSQPQSDGGFVMGTLAWGYRSYNFHSFYGLGLQIYVSTRVHMDDPSHYEITAGIEVDLAALFVIPAMFLISLFRGGSPDEPEVAEE
jgi:hypothetical protein